MNILVTGGTGYIGSHTCVEFLEAGFNVIILDNFSNSNSEVVDRIEKITNKRVKLYILLMSLSRLLKQVKKIS